jgi:hypothetical protein
MTTVTEAERNFINRSVASLTALKAVSISPRRDGSTVRLEGSPNGVYSYNSTSTATPNDLDVVKPDAITLPDPGRWLRVGAETSNDGTLAANSDNLLSTQKSIKNYVDAHPGTNVTAQTDGWGTDWGWSNGITNGQTAFTLSEPPVSDDAFHLYINGQLINLGLYYLRDGTSLIWLNPVIDGQTITLKTTDELVANYNFLGGGVFVKNITEKGFGLNVKHEGDNTWSSTSNVINHLWQLNEDNPSDPYLIKMTSHGLTSGTLITTENAAIDYFVTRKGYQVPYKGIIAPARELGDLLNVTMVRSGSTVTVENNNIITQFGQKVIKTGDKVAIRDAFPTDYNGIHTVTSVDAATKKYTFTIAGTPIQPTSVGRTVIHYEPKTYLNNAVFKYSLVGETSPALITLKTNTNIPNGYSFSVIAADAAEEVNVLIDDSSVKLRGMKSNTWIPTEWTQSTSPKPRLHTWMTTTFFYAGTEGGAPIWYIREAYVLDAT